MNSHFRAIKFYIFILATNSWILQPYIRIQSIMPSWQCITEWVHSTIFRHVLEECMTISVSYILQLSLHTVWQLTSTCERKQFLYLFPWVLGKLFLMSVFVGFLHYSIGGVNVQVMFYPVYLMGPAFSGTKHYYGRHSLEVSSL